MPPLSMEKRSLRMGDGSPIDWEEVFGALEIMIGAEALLIHRVKVEFPFYLGGN